MDRLCAKRPSQIIYGLDETTKKAWLEDFGNVLLRLHQTYSVQSSPRYELIERLLLEQYQIEGEEQRVELKPAQEISADSLQSPHDEDAAYRKKKDETVWGYSANVTETCEEELNLIVDVQVEPATAADNAYLKAAVQNSEAVLEGEAQEISADGAYYSEANETYAKEQDKEIHYTGFPGKPGRYDYERTEDGVVVTDRERGETKLAEEYKPGRYRFRVEGKWRYITDKDIATAACRRRTEDATSVFNGAAMSKQRSYSSVTTPKKKLKYRGKRASCGLMPSRVDQHEANCEPPDETGRGDRLIEGLRPKITTQPLDLPFHPTDHLEAAFFHLRFGKILSEHLTTCVS